MHPKVPIQCHDCRAEFLGTTQAKYCPACRWTHRGRKTKKYIWTAEKDALLTARYDGKIRNRTLVIANQLGWPKWVITKRAAHLGLCYPWLPDRKDWTPEEEAFLEQHAGTRHVNYLRRTLKRSLTSVTLKLKRMGLRRRMADGYCLRDLCDCFGVDHHSIERWVRDGKLKVGRWNPDAGQHAMWCAQQRDVLKFVRAYPLAFRLDKVDQVWFLDLVLGGNLLGRTSRHEDQEAEAV
jgi:hypothetical protein